MRPELTQHSKQLESRLESSPIEAKDNHLISVENATPAPVISETNLLTGRIAKIEFRRFLNAVKQKHVRMLFAFTSLSFLGCTSIYVAISKTYVTLASTTYLSTIVDDLLFVFTYLISVIYYNLVLAKCIHMEGAVKIRRRMKDTYYDDKKYPFILKQNAVRKVVVRIFISSYSSLSIPRKDNIQRGPSARPGQGLLAGPSWSGPTSRQFAG